MKGLYLHRMTVYDALVTIKKTKTFLKKFLFFFKKVVVFFEKFLIFFESMKISRGSRNLVGILVSYSRPNFRPLPHGNKSIGGVGSYRASL